jgi:hypothetical protein
MLWIADTAIPKMSCPIQLHLTLLTLLWSHDSLLLIDL